MTTGQITHEDFVTGWNDVAERHRAAWPDAWRLAAAAMEAHSAVVVAISQAAGSTPSRRDRALLAVVAHAMNVYGALVGHLYRGEFDVSVLLIRALFDSGALAVGTGLDEEYAAAFIEGRLRASEIRRQQVELMRAAGDGDLADETDRILREDASAADSLAHVNTYVVEWLLELRDDRVRPTIGGRFDLDGFHKQALAIIGMELRLLSTLAQVRDEALGGEPKERIEECGRLWAALKQQDPTETTTALKE